MKKIHLMNLKTWSTPTFNFSIKTPVSSSSKPQHLQLLNKQQLLSLLQQTKIKKSFCILKIPSRMMQPYQTMTIYSLVIHQNNNHSISTISTPNHHSQRIASTPSSILNFNTPTILSPVGK